MSTSNAKRGGLSFPPGPSIPGPVQTLRWMLRPNPMLERARRRYGPIFSLKLGPGRPVVVVADPRAAHRVIAGDPQIFRAGDINGLMRPVVGDRSLLLVDGDEHQTQRRLLRPAFSRGHADRFTDWVREAAEARIDGWASGEALELSEEMEAISLAAILRVVFGDRVDPREPELTELIPEMMRRCDSPFTLVPWFRRELAGRSPYGRLMTVVDRIDRVIGGAIADRRDDPLTQIGGDVMSLLISARDDRGDSLPDEAIRDQILTMIMAGYETTSSALSWAFERMLRSPASLDRLTTELADGETGYLDAVIKETLRCRPVVPIVGRRVTAPLDLMSHQLPPGTVVLVAVVLIHNDPDVYPDADRFRPERFIGDKVHPNSWLPFGGGVRRCLGAAFAQLEMAEVLRAVLARAELSAVGEAEPPVRERFTLRPEKGCRVVVESVDGRRRARKPSRFTRARRTWVNR